MTCDLWLFGQPNGHYSSLQAGLLINISMNLFVNNQLHFFYAGLIFILVQCVHQFCGVQKGHTTSLCTLHQVSVSLPIHIQKGEIQWTDYLLQIIHPILILAEQYIRSLVSKKPLLLQHEGMGSLPGNFHETEAKIA